MTTETKVEAVAVVMRDGYICWLNSWLMSDNYVKSQQGDHLYPASAITALEGEVECLRVQLAGSQERAMMVLRAKDDWMDRANKAERRVAELEAAAEPFVRFSSGERYIDLRMPTSAIERMRRLLRKDDGLTKESP